MTHGSKFLLQETWTVFWGECHPRIASNVGNIWEHLVFRSKSLSINVLICFNVERFVELIISGNLGQQSKNIKKSMEFIGYVLNFLMIWYVHNVYIYIHIIDMFPPAIYSSVLRCFKSRSFVLHCCFTGPPAAVVVGSLRLPSAAVGALVPKETWHFPVENQRNCFLRKTSQKKCFSFDTQEIDVPFSDI